MTSTAHIMLTITAERLTRDELRDRVVAWLDVVGDDVEVVDGCVSTGDDG